MERFTKSIEESIRTENWYAALSLALIMPDICSKIENPDQATNKRYPEWFDTHLGDRYSAEIGAEHTKHVFLSGADCYAFRCSLLHEGRGETFHQSMRDAIDRFHFIAPTSANFAHRNLSGNVLQLEIPQFCIEIINAVDHWYTETVAGNSVYEDRCNSLLCIYDLNGNRVA